MLIHVDMNVWKKRIMATESDCYVFIIQTSEQSQVHMSQHECLLQQYETNLYQLQMYTS